MGEGDATPINDDEVRWLLVRTAASLARLWARIERAKIQPGRIRTETAALRDLNVSETWLATTPDGTAVSGVERAVLLAQGLLLDAAVSPQAIDRRWACLIIQHVSCGATTWSEQTLRLAARLGVTLATTPSAECHGSTLHTAIYRLDGTYAEAAARAARDSKR